VQRGDAIAKSGNVGNSGVRHIHFDVHDKPGGKSIPSRFDGGSHACSKAHYADWPDSTQSLNYPVEYRTVLYGDYNLPLKRYENARVESCG
jgi:murein DD-endopeptidase MepM/ murein hydrolase activator NlpD